MRLSRSWLVASTLATVGLAQLDSVLPTNPTVTTPGVGHTFGKTSTLAVPTALDTTPVATPETNPVTTAVIGTTAATTADTAAGASNTAILFSPTDFDNDKGDYALYMDAYSDNVDGVGKMFQFTVGSASINVTGAKLYEGKKNTVIASAAIGAGAGTGMSTGTGVTISVNVADLAGSVTIQDTAKIFDAGLEGVALYFEITWNEGTAATGLSYSRAFAFSHPLSFSALLPSFANTNPVSPETLGGTAKTTAASTRASTITGAGTITSAETNLPSATGGVLPSLSSSKKHNGLGGGAIAGIVIGVLAVVAIAGAVVFFLLRRRARKNGDGGIGYKPAMLPAAIPAYRGGRPDMQVEPGTADNLMAEKDGPADGNIAPYGAGPDGGPHSPYTDEERTDRGEVAAAAAAVAPAAVRRDTAGISPPVSPVVARATPATPAAAQAPALASQVAALIEDHMTPEDVARLEEEERELDAAIANASRNRSANR